MTEGYGALPAFGLINRSKSETQGQLSRRGGAIRARLGLLFLGLTGQGPIRIHEINWAFMTYMDGSIVGLGEGCMIM